VSLSASTSATPSASSASTATFVEDLPPAIGDLIVENDGDDVPVPFPDPDADGDDPDEVEPRDESTSGPDDQG
jgi:hypothetical protein